MPQPVRILLSEAASQALLAAGEECWVMACRATFPDQPNRVAVHFRPVDKATAEKLAGVLLGTHRATKIRVPKESGGLVE